MDKLAIRRASSVVLATSVSLLGLMAAPAHSQTSPDTGTLASGEIVVTATKRATLIQNVPFSINAQTSQDIARAHAQTLEDLSRNVAGLSIQNLGPGQSQVAIRGISSGQIVRDQPGVKEQVGVYLDESVISLSLFTPDLDLFDLNRVETLRGPQGTLFGAGSEGGTIRYITNQPKFDRVEGSFEAGFNHIDGGNSGGDVKGAINLPLGETAAVRAVGYYTRYAGFIDALHEDGSIKKNVNDGYRAGGRVAVTWKPIDALTITPRVIYQEIKTNGFNREEKFNLFANPFTTTRPPVTLQDRQQFLLLPEEFRDKFLLVDNTATLDVGPASLTSVSSYTHRNILVSRDASALTGSVSVDLGFPTAAVLLPSNLRDRTKLNQFTQELRVASNGEGPLQWLVGGFYSHIRRNYSQRLPTPGYDAFTDAIFGAGTSAAVANGFGPDSPYNADLPYKLRQLAAFAELTYNLTHTLHLTAGGRYYDYKETRRFHSGGLFSNDDDRRDSTTSNGATPRFLVSFDATPNMTFNAQVSKGFRLGGVNDPLNLPLCGPADAATFGGHPTFKDETLWNYEGGLKAHFGPLRFNVAGFYNEIHNLQVTADAGSCSSRVIFNVPKAHSGGGEFEVAATPIKGLDLSLSGSLIDSKFDSTVTSSTGVELAGIRKGNRLPTVPKFQLSANGTYTVPVDVFGSQEAFFTASVQHVGSRYTQPADQEGNPQSFVSHLPFGGATGNEATVLDLKLPAYDLVNLSAGLRFPGQLEISVYVNNLTDKNALLSFDRERGGRARLGFEVNQPRTFGATLRKSF
ncbi:MAG TPA: TonB-dependent receptor [Acetobacteraceae bacterium]|nr:TonB-dependent receptor [Acetobacteraceae bacterium]